MSKSNAQMYILKCSDNSYYAGVSENLENRLKTHERGEVKFTSRRLPVKLIYFEEFLTLSAARKREIEIKHWRREKKEKLINSSTNLLKTQQIQKAKEQAILIAMRKGMALVRRDLEIHGLRIDGQTTLISKSASYDRLWRDALSALTNNK